MGHSSRELFADVSSNNGPISVPHYSRAGHVLLAIKATQGVSYVNPDYLEQVSIAHEYGLTVLHYHFCEPELQAGTLGEIEHFRNWYNKVYRRGDYTCFDIEKNQSTRYCQRLLREYYLRTHHGCVLYCDRSDFQDKYNGVYIPELELWIANYSSNPVNVGSNHKLLAEQYTDGKEGPEPHFYSGIGKSDGSYLSSGPARALFIRKIRTRKRK